MHFAFFQPGYLWALLFLAAVLLIHLLRRRRAVRLDFSTLRFFQTTAVRAHAARRIRRILLLLTRGAIAALVVFIFAGPFNPRNPAAILRNPQVTLFTWIDPTMSMEYRAGGTSTGERAEACVDSLLRRIAPTAKVLRYDETRKEFLPPGGQAGQWKFIPRYGPPELDGVLRSFNELRHTVSLPALLLLSDCQISSSLGLDTLLKALASEVPVMTVSLTPESPWNFSVQSVSGENRQGIYARVKAQGRSLDNGEVDADIAGMRAGHSPVSVSRGDSVQTAVDIASDLQVSSGKLLLNQSDPLEWDNADYFTKDRAGGMHVLIAGDTAANTVVAAAFRAAPQSWWNPVVVKSPAAISFDDIDSADLVVISGLTQPSPALESLAGGAIPGQKAIICVLETEEPASNWSMMLALRAIPSLHALAVRRSTTAHYPVLPDTISSLWSGFPGARTLEAAVYNYVDSLPGSPIIRLDNGAVLASRFRDRDNREWIFLSTPVNISASNNLCETGFYVPFIDRIAHAATADLKNSAETWYAGETKRNPCYGKATFALVYDADGKMVTKWENQPVIMFDKPGIYSIVPQNESPYRIAVKADPAEGLMQFRKPAIPRVKPCLAVVMTGEEFLSFIKKSSGMLPAVVWIVLAGLIILETLLWERRAVGTPGRSRP